MLSYDEGLRTYCGRWFSGLTVRPPGSARLSFEDTLFEMKPGDFVNIPAHRKHRVEWTTPDEPTIWLAVHYNAVVEATG